MIINGATHWIYRTLVPNWKTATYRDTRTQYLHSELLMDWYTSYSAT